MQVENSDFVAMQVDKSSDFAYTGKEIPSRERRIIMHPTFYEEAEKKTD